MATRLRTAISNTPLMSSTARPTYRINGQQSSYDRNGYEAKVVKDKSDLKLIRSKETWQGKSKNLYTPSGTPSTH